jgi:hypothetical protein
MIVKYYLYNIGFTLSNYFDLRKKFTPRLQNANSFIDKKHDLCYNYGIIFYDRRKKK